MLSFHPQGALISPENTDASVALGKWFAARTGYDYYDGWDFFGTATRWFTETTGRPAVTIEISRDMDNDWQRNNAALLDFIAAPGNLPPAS